MIKIRQQTFEKPKSRCFPFMLRKVPPPPKKIGFQYLRDSTHPSHGSIQYSESDFFVFCLFVLFFVFLSILLLSFCPFCLVCLFCLFFSFFLFCLFCPFSCPGQLNQILLAERSRSVSNWMSLEVIGRLDSTIWHIWPYLAYLGAYLGQVGCP